MAVNAALRFKVLERDGFTCQYCGSRDDLQADHVIPEALGGPTTLWNLITACRTCNSGKSATLIGEIPTSALAAAIVNGRPRKAVDIMRVELKKEKHRDLPRPARKTKSALDITARDWVNRFYSMLGRGMSVTEAMDAFIKKHPLNANDIRQAAQYVMREAS
jgi:hypothetical protein